MATKSNIQEIRINNFFGGVSDDPRKSSASEFIISKHFNIFSQPNRLIPYRSLEADTNDGSTSTGMKQYLITNFLFASQSAKLYGIGQTAGGQTQIATKAAATTGNWATSAGGDAAPWKDCLVEYKDYLWGFQGNAVWKYGVLSGSPSITNAAGTVGTITSVAQGVIGKDDNLYLPYNNKLVRVVAGGTVNDAVLTLPTNFKITSICNYGNYLAIAAAPISIYNGVSKVFLWNLTSPDVQEAIGWGEGELRVLDTIEGMLVGVTDRYLNNTVGAGRGSLIIQGYSGGTPQVLKEVFTQALTNVAMPLSKAVINNRLFFAARIMTNTAGTEYNEGIWSFGRKNASYPYALTLDVIDENINSSGIQGFGTAGNYFFIAHSGDGSIDKTDDTAAYNFTSIYESQIFDFADAATTKQIKIITITTAPIVAGSVTVKLKKDNDNAWTTVGSLSTVGEVSRDFYVIESTQLAFPTGGEFRFRVESTGGVEVTSLLIEYADLFGSTG